jgi:hypothetical protein
VEQREKPPRNESFTQNEKNTWGPVTLMKNDSVALGLSAKIIK